MRTDSGMRWLRPARWKRPAIGLIVGAVLLGCAHERETPAPAVKDALVQRTATVEAIDMGTRMVALRDEDGSRSTVMVGPEVRNLPQVRVGDRVVVSYYTAIAAELKPPGTGAGSGTSEPDVTTSIERAKPGGRPAGAVAQSVQTTVKVQSVDQPNNIITFRRSDGYLRTVVVRSPEGQRFLAGLKPGDEVELTYTEALAVEVRPANVAAK
jgi:hypothetical protein